MEIINTTLPELQNDFWEFLKSHFNRNTFDVMKKYDVKFILKLNEYYFYIFECDLFVYIKINCFEQLVLHSDFYTFKSTDEFKTFFENETTKQQIDEIMTDKNWIKRIAILIDDFNESM